MRFILKTVLFYFICLFLVCEGRQCVGATPVIIKEGRLVMDWGALKLRFDGLYEPKLSSSTDVDQEVEQRLPWYIAEDKAASEGLFFIQKVTKDLHFSYYSGQLNLLSDSVITQNADRAGSFIARTTYIYNTIYYKGGGVRVEMENSLTKVFRRNDVYFRGKDLDVKEGEQDLFSSISIVLDKNIRPEADYDLIDESGSVLFNIEDMDKASYEKNLMGRWFYPSQRSWHEKHQGPNPLFIKAKVKDQKRYIIDRDNWNKVGSVGVRLLRQGKVLLMLPKNS